MELVGYLGEICRFLMVIVLGAAAYTKASDLRGFTTALTDDFRVPARFAKSVALVVIASEVLAPAGLLLGGSAGRAAAWLALITFICFSAIILEAVINRRRVFCSCFGRSSQPVSSLDLVRNAIYIGAAVVYLAQVHQGFSGSLLAQACLLMTAALAFVLSMGLHEIRNLLRA